MMSGIYLPAFNDYIREKKDLNRFFIKQDIQLAKTKNKQTDRKKHSSDQGNANQNPNGKKSSCPYRVEQTKKLWYIVINSKLNSSLNE